MTRVSCDRCGVEETKKQPVTYRGFYYCSADLCEPCFKEVIGALKAILARRAPTFGEMLRNSV